MPFVFNPFTGNFDATSDPLEEAFTFVGDCSAGEAVGDCVYVSGAEVLGVIQVRKVDVTDPAKMPAIGIILDKPTATTCTVAYSGGVTIGILPPFLPGRMYFVGHSSKPDATRPASPAMVQVVGVAVTSGRLLFNPSPNMTRTI